MRRICTRLLAVLILLVISGCGSDSTVPVGWNFGGNRANYYHVTIEGKAARGSNLCAVLSSRLVIPSRGNTKLGFGTLSQSVDAERYRNKRIAVSAFVRAERVEKWAGVWARVDGLKEMLAFDNMGQRPIRGTRKWSRYRIIMDVPEEAKLIHFGVLLNGRGRVSVDEFDIAPVGLAIAPTAWNWPARTDGSKSAPVEPANLDFEDGERSS